MAGNAKARSIAQAGVPEWHLRNAQAYYERHGLRLFWAYPQNPRKAGWALQGFRDTGPGTCFHGLLRVELDEACDAPHATRRRWEAFAAREGVVA